VFATSRKGELVDGARCKEDAVASVLLRLKNRVELDRE
jgi:hypothetical protein